MQLFGTPRASANEVAGAAASTETSEITIEKIAVSATSSEVAPATLDRAALGPVTEEELPATPENVVLETPPSTLETPAAAAPVGTPPPVAESVVLTSDFATTSREGIPAAVTSENQGNMSEIPLPLHSATASSLWLSMLYSILAVFVIGALLVSLAVEWRRHHLVQSAYAGGLLAVMALLLYIHTALTGHVVIL